VPSWVDPHPLCHAYLPPTQPTQPTQPTKTAFALQSPYSRRRAWAVKEKKKVVVGCCQPCRRRAPLARSPGVSEQGSPLFSKTINFSTYLRPPLSLHRPRLPPVPVPLLQRPRCRCLRSPRCNICNIAWSVVAVSAFCFAYHGTLSLHARLHSPASTCTQPAPLWPITWPPPRRLLLRAGFVPYAAAAVYLAGSPALSFAFPRLSQQPNRYALSSLPPTIHSRRRNAVLRPCSPPLSAAFIADCPRF
jgi:hypothetical protein